MYNRNYKTYLDRKVMKKNCRKLKLDEKSRKLAET